MLSYTQIQHLLSEIRPRLEGTICHAIGMHSETFVLEFQDHSNNFTRLLICLNSSFQRFHITKKPLPPIANTSFFKTLNKYLSGKTVASCSLLNEDRILSICFSDNTQLITEFLPRRPNCYLLNSASQILTSWYPSQNSTYQLPEKPPNQNKPAQNNQNITSLSLENEYDKQEKEALFCLQKQTLLKQLQRLILRAEKHVQQRQLTLKQCQDWRQLQHHGSLLQSQIYLLHKGMTETVVDDWENNGQPQTIPLDASLEPYQQIDLFFKRSKKLRLAIPHAERMLQQAQEEYSRQHSLLASLQTITSLEELQIFCHKNNLSTNTPGQTKPSQTKKSQPAKPYHIYALTNGLYAWVGKSAKDNDKLSFQHANGSDWWLHVRDYPGSHITVRGNKNQTLDGETLKDAAELALRFSKAKNIKVGEVVLTQVKNLTRVKGVPGKVQLSKHKIISHTLDQQRWQRLKNSKHVQ